MKRPQYRNEAPINVLSLTARIEELTVDRDHFKKLSEDLYERLCDELETIIELRGEVRKINSKC